MKKFEYNFYNVWGGNTFQLLSVDFYKARTANYLEITICNFEFDFIYRTDKQLKEQKKWEKTLNKNLQEIINDMGVKKTSKKKVAAKKRKTTK